MKQDLHKRRKLLNFYTAVESSLAKMDRKSLELLRKNVGDVERNLATKKRRLNQKDYVVLVAGRYSFGYCLFVVVVVVVVCLCICLRVLHVII